MLLKQTQNWIMRETDPNLGSVGFDRTGLSHSVDYSRTESITFSHVCGSNQIREFGKLPLSTLLFQERVRNMEGREKYSLVKTRSDL